MADSWLRNLRPAAQQLWRDLVAERQAADPRFGGTRALLVFSRLSTNSWNQYATALRSFCDFCASLLPPVTLDQVQPHHLIDYVCWLAERPNPLKHATVASYLSGIRSVLAECKMMLPPDQEIRAVLDGYKRWRAAVQEPEIKRPAWPARFTMAATRLARKLLGSCGDTFLSKEDHALVVYAAYIVVASKCFSRGDTVIGMLLQHILVTTEGAIKIRLDKQKRPKDFIPEQEHHRTTDPDCPVRFLTDCYLPYLSRLGYGPASSAFGLTAQAKARPLDAAVKQMATSLGAEQLGGKPWTGHCVRIGAISEAFAVGVPLAKIAHFAGHRSTTTTEGYVRHDVVADRAAQTFFAPLVPLCRGVDALTL